MYYKKELREARESWNLPGREMTKIEEGIKRHYVKYGIGAVLTFMMICNTTIALRNLRNYNLENQIKQTEGEK